MGLFWGLITGQWAESLSIAIFYELCWLDIIPAGTFIPPQLAAATFASLALTTQFWLTGPQQIVIALVLGLPLAWVGYRIEEQVRAFNNRSYNSLLNWGRHSDRTDMPLLLIVRSVLVQLGVFWLFFFVSILVLSAVMDLILPMLRRPLADMNITWPHLWLAASFGGLMALRLKKAYMVLAVGVVLATGAVGAGLL